MSARLDPHIVVELDRVPAESRIAAAAEHAYFSESFAVPCNCPDMTMPAAFFAVFGHHPLWLKCLLITRNAVARLFGLEVADAESILRPVRQPAYRIGELIGPWPIFFSDPNELVAGRDEIHLDFRVSVLRQCEAGKTRLIVSTICLIHNRAGARYLAVILPFHRWGMRRLMRDAVSSGRLNA